MSSPLLEPRPASGRVSREGWKDEGRRVAVVGATTWGTALAIILAKKSLPVSLLARTSLEAERLQSDRRNARFLPNSPFPESLTVTSEPGEALPSAELVIIAVPSHSVRDNMRSVRDNLTPGVVIVSAAKGLELPGGKRMSQVMEEELSAELLRRDLRHIRAKFRRRDRSGEAGFHRRCRTGQPTGESGAGHPYDGSVPHLHQ